MAAKKKRNYAAEYKRRIERLTKLGLSRSQARGHPKFIGYSKKGKRLKEKSITEMRQTFKLTGELRSTKTRSMLKGFTNDMISMIDFIAMAVNAGHTLREAYSLWFSP